MPLAEIEVDTPYLVGKIEAVCMGSASLQSHIRVISQVLGNVRIRILNGKVKLML